MILFLINLLFFVINTLTVFSFENSYVILLINSVVLIFSFVYRRIPITSLTSLILFWKIFIELPSYYICLQNPDIAFYQSALIAFSVSSFILHFFLPLLSNFLQKKNFTEFKKKSFVKERDFRFVMCISAVSIFTAIIYFGQTPTIPLFSFFSSESSNVAQLREDSLKNLDLPSAFRYLIFWSRDLFFPVVFAFSVISWKKLSKNKKLILFFINFFGIFFISSTTEKAPVVMFFLCGFVANYIFNNFRFNIIKYWYYLPLIPSFAILIFYLNSSTLVSDPNQAFSSAFENLYSRVFYVPARVGMIHFEVFPRLEPFLNGASISGFEYIIDKPFFNLSNFLYLKYNPFPESGTNPTGYANAAFVSEMWANFGWYGVLLSSFFCGILLTTIDFLIFRRKVLDFVSVSVYGCVIVANFNLISTNLTTFMITKGVLICFLFFLFSSTKSPYEQKKLVVL